MLRRKQDQGPPDQGDTDQTRNRDPGAFDLSLSDFLLEHMDPQAGYKCRLFRVYSPPGRQEKCAFLQSWADTIPEYEEIASEYGPGTYRLNVIYTPPGGKRTATSRRFDIDPNWGGKSTTQIPGGNQGAASMGMYGAQEAQRQQMQMFQMFLSTLVQVFNGQQKGNGNGGAGAGVAALMEMQKAMAQITMDNYDSQNRLIAKMARDRLDVGEDEPSIDGEAPFVMQAIQWLMAAWKQYGSQIMSNPKIAGKFLQPKAQGVAQIEYALSHPDEYENLYRAFIDRSGAKSEAIDEFIHALGYPTPQELKAQANQAANQAEG